jgi:hypothetical protein
MGRRRNWTALLLAILAILHDGGGGGDSDIVARGINGKIVRTDYDDKKSKRETNRGATDCGSLSGGYKV